MRIVYTARSRQDLADIVDGLASRNVHAALVVAATIRKRIAWLARYPSSGRAQEGTEVRKAVTEPFGYFIYYVVGETAQTVTIVTILPPALV
ncbi:MAG: type II toxin-antitoxin system RelE/ParE family toxin [Janthinobacterium lividum]